MALKQALLEYYNQNSSFTPYQKLKSARAQRLVCAHDISHLIFGCATDLEGEITVQLWTKHAAQMSLSATDKIMYLLEYEALRLVVNREALSFFIVRHRDFRIFNTDISARARNMISKWQYFKGEDFFEERILDIRKKFGISIL